jgi:hypothetical protein
MMSSESISEKSRLPTGFLENLNAQQSEALESLRSRILASKYKEDFEREPGEDRFLLQFLRATMKDKSGERIFQVDAAEQRLTKAFDWRREVNAYEILQNIINDGPKPDKFEVFSAMYPALDIINEETGQLVRFLRFGRFISTVDINALTLLEWSRCFCYECLYLQHQLRVLSKKHGRDISTYYVVSDMSGISLFSVANRVGFIKLMSSFASDNFPEMMGRTFLVNGPSILPAAYNLAKPFIDKDVQNKFLISSSCPTDEIANIIPITSIPKEYGGTSETIFPKVLADRK